MYVLMCAGMEKKKVSHASKIQLRQALLQHASSKTAEASRPLALEKGMGQPGQPAMPRPLSLVALKRRRLSKVVCCLVLMSFFYLNELALY